MFIAVSTSLVSYISVNLFRYPGTVNKLLKVVVGKNLFLSVFNSSISDHFSELRGKEAGGEAYLTKFDASVFYKEISKVIKSHVETV